MPTYDMYEQDTPTLSREETGTKIWGMQYIIGQCTTLFNALPEVTVLKSEQVVGVQ